MHRKLRILAKGGALIAALVAGGLALKHFGPDEALFRGLVEGHPAGAGGIRLPYLVGTAVFTMLGGPRQIPAFFAGYALGVWEGLLVSVSGTGLALVLDFLFARHLARGLVRRKYGPVLERMDACLEGSPFTASLAIRLMPLGNNFLTNLAAGVSSIRLRHFLAGSLLGYVPQNFVFALLGSGIHVDPALRISIGVGLFVIATLLGFRLYQRFQARVAREG